MDKSWVYEENRVSAKYLQGVANFLDFALKSSVDEKLACPCTKCANSCSLSQDAVAEHLLNNGFSRSYTNWYFHGELSSTSIESYYSKPTQLDHEQNEFDIAHNVRQFLGDMAVGHNSIREGVIPNEDDHNVSSLGETSNMEPYHGEINKDVEKFYRLLKETEGPLFDGCKTHSKLSFILDLFHKKCINGWSNKSFKGLLELLRTTFPGLEQLPKSSYEVKKLISELGLGYEKIHVCPNYCLLFWKDKKDYSVCSICGASRWVEDGNPNDVGSSRKANKKKSKPRKVFRWFPLKPRLQRLFMCSKTASLMQWHFDERKEDGFFRHPTDARAWKEFDSIHKEFSRDPCNV